MTSWIRVKKPPQTIHNIFSSLWSDLTTSGKRFSWLQYFITNTPGDVGLTIRYYLYKPFFKKIGTDVIFWPGIRMRHPQKMKLGDNVQLGYDNHYQASAGISIGKNTILSPNVNIWTVNHVHKDITTPIRNQGYEKRSISIGENCWITTRCFIIAGAVIPDGCIILPGTTVGIMKIPPNSIVGGNPAKVMGNRKLLSKLSKFKQK